MIEIQETGIFLDVVPVKPRHYTQRGGAHSCILSSLPVHHDAVPTWVVARSEEDRHENRATWEETGQ